MSDAIIFSVWLALVVAAFADFAVRVLGVGRSGRRAAR